MLRENASTKTDDGFVSQVLFPAEQLLQLKSHSYLVGWNLDNFRCCISFVVEIPEQQYEQLCEIIRLSCIDQMKLLSSCSKSGSSLPVVLGEFIPNLDADYAPNSSRRMEGIWITLTANGTDSKHPKLHSLYSLGCLYSTSCYLFEYKYVDTDRLACLKPEQNVNFDQFKHSSRLGSELDFIIAQINASCDLENTIRHNLRREAIHVGPLGGRLNRITSAVVSICTLFVSIPSWIWYSASRRTDRALHHKYGLFHMGALFANWLGLRGAGSIDATSGGGPNSPNGTHKLDGSSPSGDKVFSTSSASSNAEGISICDISLCATHLSERITRFEACLRKCAVFPYSWTLPARLKQSVWISVFSFLTILWVDVLAGCVLGLWVFRHANDIVLFLEQSCENAQRHFILDSLVWFSQSPGGVKLNILVTTKVGAALKAIVGTYHTVLVDTKALHLPIIQFVGCFGVLGLTSQLVLLVDVMRLTTLHIATTHRILAFFHQQQLQLLYSLSLLFRGEKRNALRRRVDTCEYDQAQLLFGTVLFAIALFLFPSFAAFYYLFAFAQFGVVLLQYLVWSTAVAIKEFPLYTMGLYFCHPALLSQGLQFSILHVGNDDEVKVTPLQRKSKTTPEFFEYDEDKNAHDKSLGKVAFFQDVSGVLTSETSFPVVADSATLSVKDAESPLPGSIRGILKSVPVSTRVEESTAEDTGGGRRRGSSNTVHFDLLAEEDEEGSDNEIFTGALPAPAPFSPTSYHQHQRYSSDNVSIISPNSFGRGEASSPVGDTSPGSRRRSPTKESTIKTTNNGHNRYVIHRNSTVYLRLLPRMQSLREVFSGYFPYMQYIASEKGFVVRLLQGVFLGRPALDIQLIHATATLSHNKSLADQSDISAAFAAAALLDKGDETRWRGRYIDNPDKDIRDGGGFKSTQSAFNANCFRPTESSGTIKNRKGVSNKTGPPLMSPSSSSGHNHNTIFNPSGQLSQDFSVVYDLPQSGFAIQTSFWETLRLARADGESDERRSDLAQSPTDDCLQAAFSSQDGDTATRREAPTTKRVNRKQRRLSRLLLYSVLITSTLSLLLATCGAMLFISALLPVHWMRPIGLDSRFWGPTVTWQTGSFNITQLENDLNSSRSGLLSHHANQTVLLTPQLAHGKEVHVKSVQMDASLIHDGPVTDATETTVGKP